MAKISFSYFVQDKLDPKTNQVIGHILRPYIPIRISLHHGNPTNYVNALVDSGSDRNLFPKLNIWVDNKKYETDADFSLQQQTPLLGRSGFFSLFKEIVFEENKSFLHIKL